MENFTHLELQKVHNIVISIEENLEEVLSQLSPTTEIAIQVGKAIDQMKEEKDVKGKFKWAVPLLPGILSYENEVSADVIGKFSKIWQDLCSGGILI